MKINIDHARGKLTVWLAGSFDMSACADFHNACRRIADIDGVETVTVDLSGVDLIDSSALGMLLILHGQAEQRGGSVSLRGAKPFVARVLTTANFQQLFRIERGEAK